MNVTSVGNTDDFLKAVIDGTKAAITQRVEKEIRPDIDRIVQEEVAKVGLRLSSMMNFERTGAQVIITIHDTKEV